MCGIAGLVLAPGAPPPSAETLSALAGALAHRGPDGAGHSVVGRTALVHTRLAIVDVAGGDQPLFAGPATLVANGEVYNDPALRRTMVGTAFSTGSDCEPPLHLWLRDGPAYAAALRGMFAIAIHDRQRRELTLTRDPFGIKPLYTALVAGGLAFASEPQALLAAGLVPRGIRTAARDELLQMQFTTGAETIFPGIRRVLPGETIRIADGRVLGRSRVAALPDGGPEDITEDAALARLDTALMDSVDAHQRSDVPYGMFLSGGVDSAAILACMARLNSTGVLAYTAGFAAPGAADERAQAAAVARAAGARHETLEITEAMVWRHLPEIVAAMDDPAADYAIIPSWFLARQARKDVKVILCGEGGDEIFAGYGRYRSTMRPWWQGGRLMRGRGTFDKLDVLRAPPVGWRDGLAISEGEAARPGRTRLMTAQATDMADWLPHDLLLKLDRCLMAHAIEGRTPFLDPAIAAAGFRLPDRLKVQDGRGKWLLRKWLETALPESRPFAPKQGFTVPIGTWIAGQGARLGPLVAAQLGVAEIAHPDRVAALFRKAAGRREGFAAWSLLFYALWHRTHVMGLAPDGDVFEVLGERMMAEQFDLVIRGGTLVLPWGEAQADVGVCNGLVAAIGVPAGAGAAATIDATGLHVLPGLIDPHVHFRDPGDPAIESIPTGSKGAVLGGITTVFDMPNTNPSITTADQVAWKQGYIEHASWCDMGLYVGASRANIAALAELELEAGVCAVKVFAGSSTGDLLIEDDATLTRVMESGRRAICYHSEDEYRLQARKPMFKSGDPYASHAVWRDEECAFLGTRRIVALARETGRPAHILHVSTAEELEDPGACRDVATVELLVNHLTQFAPDAYEQLGGLAVMNPPIRDRRHYDAAWEAVRNGTADTIGSDHAPHARAAKERPWPEVAAGLTGVQTTVPIMLDHVNAGRLSLARMVDLMCAGPARVYGVVGKGRLAVGYDADFTLVDLKAKRTIEEKWIVSPCGWTPFAGMQVTGWPMATIIRGQSVMRDDEVLGEPSGKLVRFRG